MKKIKTRIEIPDINSKEEFYLLSFLLEDKKEFPLVKEFHLNYSDSTKFLRQLVKLKFLETHKVEIKEEIWCFLTPTEIGKIAFEKTRRESPNIYKYEKK